MLIPGAAAPKLVTREHGQAMKPGAVIVDVAIDQGGCFETSRPTTHADPTYVVDGVVHYCVANMPGAVAAPRPSRSTTRPCRSCARSPTRATGRPAWTTRTCWRGLNVHRGQITYQAVARDLGLPYTPPGQALNAA